MMLISISVVENMKKGEFKPQYLYRCDTWKDMNAHICWVISAAPVGTLMSRRRFWVLEANYAPESSHGAPKLLAVKSRRNQSDRSKIFMARRTRRAIQINLNGIHHMARNCRSIVMETIHTQQIIIVNRK